MISEQRKQQLLRYKQKHGFSTCWKYEKTKKGFLMRLYRNMESRVTGVQKLKLHLYRGKYLLPRQRFYDWALMSPEFHRLFEQWERKDYDRKYAPSVDRRDSTKGYTLANMEWVTHSENSRRGAIHSAAIHQQYKNLYPWKKAHGLA